MLKFMPPSRVPRRSAVSLAEQHQAISKLIIEADLSLEARHRISQHAAQMVRRIRADAKPALLEAFLAEYDLSNAEGIALMRLAKTLLRDPDASTIDALVADKIAPGHWAAPCGHAASALVNTSTLGLLTTSRVLSPQTAGAAAQLSNAMTQMGRQFVLGQTIQAALKMASHAGADTLHS